MIDASGWEGEVFYHGIVAKRIDKLPLLGTLWDSPSNLKFRRILSKDGRYLRTRKDYIIHSSRLQVTFNFLNQLTSLYLSLRRRFQSLDELPTGLQAMDASNTTSLVWIFTGLNWELSKQLQCFGCSKVLKKIRTSNPKNKLLNVSLLSLFLFDRIWFLDQNSLLMILMY